MLYVQDLDLENKDRVLWNVPCACIAVGGVGANAHLSLAAFLHPLQTIFDPRHPPAPSHDDLVNMEKELLEDGQAVWVVNPRVIPQLRQMEDTAGHLIWQEDARSGTPSTLLGRPVVRNYRSPALGTLGDVVLLVPSYYVIKDGVDVTIAASEHALFGENKTVVKAFKSVDGGPWLDGPIQQEDNTTYSPFVALDVP